MLVHNVHSSTSHNRQKVEIAQMSINRWMEKQNAAHPYNGILLSHKKEWSGNSLAVQWLGLSVFTGRALVQFLVWQLRSCKPRSAAIKKKNEVLICATTWINLKHQEHQGEFLLQKNRHERPPVTWSRLYEMSRTGRSIETESRSVVAWGWGRENGSDCSWCWGLFWDDGNVLELDSNDGCTTL